MINLHNYEEAKDASNLFKRVTYFLYHQFPSNKTHLLTAQTQTRNTSLPKWDTTQNQANEKPTATVKTMLPTWL